MSNITIPVATSPIVGATTAVVVIDMQKDNVDQGAPMFNAQAHAAIGGIKRMLGLARSRGLRVIYVRQAHRPDGSDMGKFADHYPAIRERRALIDGTPGAEICDELRPEPGDISITKRRHSAFVGTDLDIVLRCSGINTLALAGLATSSCVLSTARDAIALDYRTIVLADGCGAGPMPDSGWGLWSSDDIHRVGLTVMSANTAEVMQMEVFAALSKP